MNIDTKIRISLLLVSAGISAFAVFASAHGLYLGFLDGIGGGTPH